VRTLADSTSLCYERWPAPTALCLLHVSSIQTERQHTAGKQEQSSASQAKNKKTLHLSASTNDPRIIPDCPGFSVIMLEQETLKTCSNACL